MPINFIKTHGSISKKEMLGIYNDALSKIAAMECQNVSICIEARFEPNHLDFTITVHDPAAYSCGFDFYSFQPLKALTTHLEKTIEIIRTDDFKKIKAATRQ